MSEFLKNNLQTGIPKGLRSWFLKHGFKITVGEKDCKSIKEVANENGTSPTEWKCLCLLQLRRIYRGAMIQKF